MLTQIFIKGDGCQSEYTKIASQSFIFHPTGLPGIDYASELYTGGDVSLMDYTYPIWSADIRDNSFTYTAGNLVGTVKSDAAAMGIPLPINLVPNDTVTISGNAFFNNASLYIEAGWEVSLIVGVYYFNCKEVTPEGARMFTFIPVSTAGFDQSSNACFNANVTLGSNFDFHNTRILVGYNIIATCPGECETPAPDANIATVSYTLDIERPCQAAPSNFVIKNCCEGSITELVNIPGLVVGDFHVDDEGNCWEVMEQSNDVTNFTRTFTSNYASCLECQDDNGCPLNLKIESCCVPGQEYVTGSLPGLVVGDTFLDNYGLCWYVSDETPAPISEESIIVDTIIEGGCETCTTENPCPNFYYVDSCCARISGVIAVPDVLNEGDSFVDAQGQCWNVAGNVDQLPTIYGIEVVTVYPVGEDSCSDCVTANFCPTEYFITIRNCCDNDRVEVAQVPAQFMIFGEGVIFQDYWGVCWEVISFSTTGIETYPITNWETVPNLGTFQDCKFCRSKKGTPCGLYEVKECGSDTTITVLIDSPVIIGLFYLLNVPGANSSCFEIIGYASPVFGETYQVLRNSGAAPTTNCQDCDLRNSSTTKILEFSQCCGGPNIIVQFTGAWYGAFGDVAMIPLSLSPSGPYTPTCVTLIGFSTTTPTLYNQAGVLSSFGGDCSICQQFYPCPK